MTKAKNMSQNDTLKKLGVGVATTAALSGAMLLNATQASAAEATTSTDTPAQAPANQTDVTVSNQDLVNQSTVVNGTVKTTTGTLDPDAKLGDNGSLNEAIKNAQANGMKANQADDKTFGSVQAAANDYVNQINSINQTISAYQNELAAFNQQQADYQAKQQQSATEKAYYDQAVTKYNDEVDAYNKYLDDVLQTTADVNNNDQLTNVASKSNTEGQTETTTITADVKTPDDLSDAIQKAKDNGITVTPEDTQVISKEELAAARANIEEAVKNINDQVAKAKVYQAKLDVYNVLLNQYNEQQAAYEEYLKQKEEYDKQGVAFAGQKLAFEKQSQATMKIEGVDTYLTQSAIDTIMPHTELEWFDKSVVDKMTNGYQATNPNAVNDEGFTNTDTWVVMKVGQPIKVTYHNLDGVKYNGNPISYIEYTYTLMSTANGEDAALAKVMHDPTETIWVGSTTTSPDEHLRVKMNIAFFDENGKQINPVQKEVVTGADGQPVEKEVSHAVLSLSSLNHYYTLPGINADGQFVEDKVSDQGHLEKVNIGNNEFVHIKGSSIEEHDDNGEHWVYSSKSNQRINEGATFDADDSFTLINQNTGEIIHATKATYGIDAFVNNPDWIKTDEVKGWDDVPGDNGTWPTNKYYGAGAVKLTDGTLEFDVSGNPKGLNTSFWFTLNSTVAVPEKPGVKPVEPQNEAQPATYPVYQVKETLNGTLPSPEPTKPNEPGQEPQQPVAPEVSWHLAKVIAVTDAPTPRTPDTPKPDTPKPDTPKPDTPKPDTPKPDTPKPDTPKPDTPKPDTPKPDTPKPDTPKPDTPKPDTPKPDTPKPTTPKGDMPKPTTAKQKAVAKSATVLPQTGNATENAGATTLLGLMVITLAAGLGLKKRA